MQRYLFRNNSFYKDEFGYYFYVIILNLFYIICLLFGIDKDFQMNYNINSEQDIAKLYHEYRDEFLRNTAKYALTKEERIDIYQDAFVVIYEGIKFGKITVEKTLKHYLFGVGRNMIIDKIKQKIKERKLQDQLLDQKSNIDIGFFDISPSSDTQDKLNHAINSLSEKCKEILVLFYYRKYSIDAIMHTMNYSNENVTKSHKSRCLKNLKAKLA